jgi:hypothetical protein
MLPKLFGGAEYTGLDGFQHSYANTVMNGFVSESTGLNIGTRVGVDGLWFRGFQPGDDLLGTATNTLVANIAPISAQANMVKGIDDMQQGEYVRGFEKMTPAAFKGLFTAYRLSTEGARTRNRKTMMEADDFTGMNLFGVIGGVQPTRLSTIQSNRIKVANQVRDADKERDALMDRFKGNVIDFEKDPKAFAETVHKMRQFNAKYPLPGTMITDETIGKSLEATIRDRNATFFGTTMNKNNWMYIMPTLLASVPVEKRDAMGVGP